MLSGAAPSARRIMTTFAEKLEAGLPMMVLFEESLLDDAAARLARVRPDSQRHDEERRRDDVAAERGDLAGRGHVNRPSVPLFRIEMVMSI